jgi:hypothetical protein
MDNINFDSVTSVRCEFTNELLGYTVVINGVVSSVPLSQGNRHYVEIMRQVESGELTVDE